MNIATTFNADSEIELLLGTFDSESKAIHSPVSQLGAILRRPLGVSDELAQNARGAITARALTEFPLGMFASGALAELVKTEKRDDGLRLKLDEMAVDSVVHRLEGERRRRAQLAAERGIEALVAEPISTGHKTTDDRNAEERATIELARMRLGFDQIKPATKLSEAIAESLAKLAKKIGRAEEDAWAGFGGLGNSQTVQLLHSVRVLFARQVQLNVKRMSLCRQGDTSVGVFAKTILRGWLPASTWQ